MLRLKHLIVLALGVCLVLAATGCSSATPSAAPNTKPVAVTDDPNPPATAPSHAIISVTEAGFTPATLSITLGTTVVWQNSGKKPHQVTFANKKTSGKIKPGGNATHVFTYAGVYQYSDPLNPGHNGTITVK